MPFCLPTGMRQGSHLYFFYEEVEEADSFVLSGVHCIFAEVHCELYRFVLRLRLQCTFRAAQFEPFKNI